MAKNKWKTNIRDFAKGYQDSRWGFDLQELSPQQVHQYQILGGTLLAWLDRYGPALIAERAALTRVSRLDTDPHIVVISSLPGLLAALEIVHLDCVTLSALTEEEYERFLTTHPDSAYRRHVVFRNTFFALQDPQLLKRARLEHPIPESAQYWVHKEETVVGELFTRTAFHLWRWDGEEYDLLSEGFTRCIR
jgi:hypothetical protein